MGNEVIQFGGIDVFLVAYQNRASETVEHNSIIRIQEDKVNHIYLEHEILDLISLKMRFNPLEHEILFRKVWQIGKDKFAVRWITEPKFHKQK